MRIRDDSKHPHYRTLLSPHGKSRRQLCQCTLPASSLVSQSAKEARIGALGRKRFEEAGSQALCVNHSGLSSHRQASDRSLASSDNTASHISVPRVLSSGASGCSAEHKVQGSASETSTTAEFSSPASPAPPNMPERSSGDVAPQGTSAGRRNLQPCCFSILLAPQNSHVFLNSLGEANESGNHTTHCVCGTPA